VLFIYTETYCAILTFDLENADAENYEYLSKKLEEISLTRNPVGKDSNDEKEVKLNLPNNVYFADFNKERFESPNALRKYLKGKLDKVFKNLNLKGKYSLVVGTNWVGMVEDIYK